MPEHEPIYVSPHTGILSRHGNAVKLTPTQERMFRLLHDYYPGVISHDRLLGQMNIRNGSGSSRLLHVHITKLREMLAPLEIGVRNEWGRGYRLVYFG